MAKDVIFQQAPPSSKIIEPITLPRQQFKGTKRHMPLIDLSQHFRVPVGETLLATDEWFNEFADTWQKTVSEGCLVGSNQVYRRRQK